MVNESEDNGEPNNNNEEKDTIGELIDFMGEKNLTPERLRAEMKSAKRKNVKLREEIHNELKDLKTMINIRTGLKYTLGDINTICIMFVKERKLDDLVQMIISSDFAKIKRENPSTQDIQKLEFLITKTLKLVIKSLTPEILKEWLESLAVVQDENKNKLYDKDLFEIVEYLAIKGTNLIGDYHIDKLTELLIKKEAEGTIEKEYADKVVSYITKFIRYRQEYEELMDNVNLLFEIERMKNQQREGGDK